MAEISLQRVFGLPRGHSDKDRGSRLLGPLTNSADNYIKGASIQLKILAGAVSSGDDCGGNESVR